ncbi:MAG: amidohydrolase [Deltaproteobacteria bacterium]|nr:amidohydrolase [Deltaproteobacteria bacterium]
MQKDLVIDADGHVLDTGPNNFESYLEPPYNKRPVLFIRWDIWDRAIFGRLGQTVFDVETRLRDMDRDGVDISVLYPTNLLAIGQVPDVGFAVALCRAYNTWLADQCRQAEGRLKGVALVPLQNVPEAVQELRRAVTELGMVGVMFPTVVDRGRNLGAPEFYPVYEEAQRLDIPIGFHSTPRQAATCDRFASFLGVHTLAQPVEQMVSVVNMVTMGIFELFPKLRIAFLEGGTGWVPWLMDRLDEEWELRGEVEAPLCKQRPSYYMLSGRAYYSPDVDEATLPSVVERMGEATILYASDYPHWDGRFPKTVELMRAQKLSEVAKAKILGENAKRFYRL